MGVRSIPGSREDEDEGEALSGSRSVAYNPGIAKRLVCLEWCWGLGREEGGGGKVRAIPRVKRHTVQRSVCGSFLFLLLMIAV